MRRPLPEPTSEPTLAWYAGALSGYKWIKYLPG
jgi:hypothetical protein